MEKHLRAYVNHFQNNWVDLLPMAEFAANANSNASIKIPPFQTIREYIPRMSFNLIDPLKESICKQLANSKTRSIAANIEEVWKFERKKIAQSQEKQAETANQHRKNIEYKVDDKVWLSTKNIKTEKLLKKLDHKMIGPYKIKQLVKLLCQLDLPISIKIHDVFYPSLLWKAISDSLPGQYNPPPPSVIVNNKQKW